MFTRGCLRVSQASGPRVLQKPRRCPSRRCSRAVATKAQGDDLTEDVPEEKLDNSTLRYCSIIGNSHEFSNYIQHCSIKHQNSNNSTLFNILQPILSRLVELYPLAATCCTFSVKRRSTPRTAGGRVGQRDDPKAISDESKLPGSEFAMRPRARSSALLVLQKCPRCLAETIESTRLESDTMPRKRNTVEARLVMLVSSFQAADSWSQGVRGLISS